MHQSTENYLDGTLLYGLLQDRVGVLICSVLTFTSTFSASSNDPHRST